MGTGMKVAIGCGIAAVFAGIVAIVAVIGGAYWVKGKVEGVADEQKKIEDLQRQASAHGFERPADGVVSEAQLQRFLGVRKAVHGVYERYREELEGSGREADLRQVGKAFSMINEIRLAQAQALVDQRMSEDEYRYLVEAVYKSAWAAAITKDTGKSVSEMAGDAARQSQEALRAAIQQAREAGQEEMARQLEQQLGQALGQEQQWADTARQLDVPQANLDLFSRYQDEIQKYSMGGLELIGL
jgi:hypothetical protein